MSFLGRILARRQGASTLRASQVPALPHGTGSAVEAKEGTQVGPTVEGTRLSGPDPVPPRPAPEAVTRVASLPRPKPELPAPPKVQAEKESRERAFEQRAPKPAVVHISQPRVEATAVHRSEQHIEHHRHTHEHHRHTHEHHEHSLERSEVHERVVLQSTKPQPALPAMQRVVSPSSATEAVRVEPQVSTPAPVHINIGRIVLSAGEAGRPRPEPGRTTSSAAKSLAEILSAKKARR